jgi:predicted dehydrogenase
MSEPINVAVIGLGRAGSHHARTFQRIPGVRLVAVCDTAASLLDPFTAQGAVKGYTDYDALLAHPGLDAVSIVLPDNAHVDAVEKALAAKKHILLEKPLASNLADAKRIAAAAKGYDRVFMVGHLVRYEARYAGAKEELRTGRIGEIIHMAFRRNSSVAGAMRYKSYTDLDMHVMVHDIDLANWFVDAPLVKVYARARSLRLASQGVKDTILAIGEYANGTLVSWEASWALPENVHLELDDKAEVVGTQGVIYIDSCEKGLNVVSPQGVRFPDTRHWPEVNGQVGGAMLDELCHFTLCIRDNARPLSGVSEALAAIEVADAVRRSYTTGREVRL